LRNVLIATLFALGAGLVPTALALTPRADSPVAVVAEPWAAADDAARAVASADGTILATARDGQIVIARFESGDFVTRLYRSGALFVIDAALVAACLRTTPSLPGATI
jgi:hypothetical protein